MNNNLNVTGTALADDGLSLDELVRVCAVSREWVVERVEEGLLPASGFAGARADAFAAAERGSTAQCEDGPASVSNAAVWRFSSRAVWRTRRMHTLERDFDAVPELAALAADLMEELERVHQRLRAAGLE